MIEVCLVVYQRLDKLPQLIKQLRNQTNQDFKLNIWNNSNSKLFIDFPIERLKIINSNKNIGSQARFKLARKTKGNPIIFIDDDLDLDLDFIEFFYKQFLQFGPDCILGWYNRTFIKEDYFSGNSFSYGEVDYLGTGGMILDRNIIDKFDILKKLPARYCKAEDLYLSYLARKEGMKLIGIKSKCRIINDGLDQFFRLNKYKQKAFRYLRKEGWRLLKDANK